MKNIFLPILSLSILFGVVLLYNSNNEKTYTPISERIISKGIDVSQQYLNDRKVNQISGKVDLSDVYEANKQVNLHRMLRSQNDHTVEWQEMGPDNVGGRTRAVLIDKEDSLEDKQTLLNGLKLVSDFMEKTILKPNNLNYPLSRIQFVSSLK